MWVPSGVIFIIVGLALFAAWLGEAERRTRPSSASIPRDRSIVRAAGEPEAS